MNYIEQLNLFDRWLEGNYLPAKAQLLWYKLMQLNNKLAWKKEFQIDNNRVMAMIEVHNRRDVNKYRNCLIDAGIIKFKSGTKNHPSSYELLPFWVADDGTVHAGGESTEELKKKPEEVPESKDQSQPEREEPEEVEIVEVEEVEEIVDVEEETSLKPVKLDRTNYNEIANFWNENCGPLPKVKSVKGNKRRNLIRARINEYSLETVKEVIVKAGQTSFLNGGSDGRWFADIDWVMRPNNFPKVLEGKYDNRNQTQGGLGPPEEMDPWMQAAFNV